MARVTARQAFTRAKVRRTLARASNSRNLNESTKGFANQVSRLGALKLTQQHISGPSIEDANNNLLGGLAAATVSKRSSRKATKSSITAHNRKITDYYPVLLRGRENVPKSPQQVVSPRLRGPQPSFQEHIEVITIDSSDEESNQHSSPSTSDTFRMKTEPLDHKCQLPQALGLKISFDNLNIDSKLDEEIEIVDMLPPIPLRKHEIFDIEAD